MITHGWTSNGTDPGGILLVIRPRLVWSQKTTENSLKMLVVISASFVSARFFLFLFFLPSYRDEDFERVKSLGEKIRKIGNYGSSELSGGAGTAEHWRSKMQHGIAALGSTIKMDAQTQPPPLI